MQKCLALLSFVTLQMLIIVAFHTDPVLSESDEN